MNRYRVERSIIDTSWLVLDPTGEVVVTCTTWREAFGLALLAATLGYRVAA